MDETVEKCLTNYRRATCDLVDALYDANPYLEPCVCKCPNPIYLDMDGDVQ